MTLVSAALALILVCGGLVWSVRRSATPDWTAWLVAVVIVALTMPSFRDHLPVDVRVFALLGSVAALLSRVRHVRRTSASVRGTLIGLLRLDSPAGRAWYGLLAGLVVWICLSVLWTPARPTYLASQFAFAGGVALCALAVLGAAPILRQALVLALAFVVATVLLEVVLDPGGARAAGRLRGPFVDANSLGLLVAFALPAVLATLPRGRWLVSLSAVAIVWETGSRTSLLALGVGALLVAVHHRRRGYAAVAALWGRGAGRVLLVVAGLGLVALVIVMTVQALRTGANDASVLRSNNSRSDVWAASQALVDHHPWRGTGIAGYDSDFLTGSSYYAAVIQLGVIGAALIAALLVLSIVVARQRATWLGVTLAIAAVTGIFEGWVLAPGGPFCLIFWVALVAWVHEPRVRQVPG